jgi:precorrin-6A synthase
MRRIFVIGIGTGDPEHMTVQAIAALNRCVVAFVLEKAGEKEDLARVRREICARFVTRPGFRIVEARDPVRDPNVASYEQRVHDWHEQRSLIYESMFRSELSEDDCGAILVWGDPSLYDSTLRMLRRIEARGQLAFSWEVIAGISSVQMLAARHKITLNRLGTPVHITTGRRLAAGFPSDVQDVVVMLDGENAFTQLDAAELDIYWGAYLGTERELLIWGDLATKGAEIVARRSAARAEHGWIMDIYLLRKRGGD